MATLTHEQLRLIREVTVRECASFPDVSVDRVEQTVVDQIQTAILHKWMDAECTLVFYNPLASYNEQRGVCRVLKGVIPVITGLDVISSSDETELYTEQFLSDRWAEVARENSPDEYVLAMEAFWKVEWAWQLQYSRHVILDEPQPMVSFWTISLKTREKQWSWYATELLRRRRARVDALAIRLPVEGVPELVADYVCSKPQRPVQ